MAFGLQLKESLLPVSLPHAPETRMLRSSGTLRHRGIGQTGDLASSRQLVDPSDFLRKVRRAVLFLFAPHGGYDSGRCAAGLARAQGSGQPKSMKRD